MIPACRLTGWLVVIGVAAERTVYAAMILNRKLSVGPLLNMAPKGVHCHQRLDFLKPGA
jgi:hypothetical protein